MDKNIKMKFPIIYSLFEECKDYDAKDIRSKLKSALSFNKIYYSEIETSLKIMPIEQQKIALEKLKNTFIKDGLFGWHQFNDVFHEINGYQLLVDMGCTDVQFIMKKAQPDIEGKIDDVTYILEAKVIHNSKEENGYLLLSASKPSARAVSINIPEEFTTKLNKTLEKATQQLNNYNNSSTSVKIIFMKVKLDINIKLSDDLWHSLDIVFEQLISKYNDLDIKLIINKSW